MAQTVHQTQPAYRWKTGLYKTDPNKAHDELLRIERKYGAVHPKDVVDESRDVRAVLHNELEWDDEKAAELHRMQQVRGIINNLVVVKPGEPEPEQPVKAFYSIKNPSTNKPEYRSIEVIVEHEEMKQSLNDATFRRLKTFVAAHETVRGM